MCSSSFISVLSVLLNDHEVEYIKFQCISFFLGAVNGNGTGAASSVRASHKDAFKTHFFASWRGFLFLANERSNYDEKRF